MLATSKTDARCRFFFDQFLGYTCELNDVAITERGQNLVIDTTTDHLSGQTDADVVCIMIGNGTDLQFFPNSVFQQFANLRNVLLDHSGLTELSAGDFAGGDAVVILHIRDATIQSIPAGLFSDLPNLLILDLSRNEISEIHDDAFENNPNILEIDINFNRLTRISSQLFRNQVNLEEFTLYNNQIEEIEDGAFSTLENLVSFYLRDNLLTELRAEVWGEEIDLVFFNLNNNRLTSIPRFPERAPRIKYLYLENNLITEIPDDAYTFSYENITNIDLSGNGIQTLSATPFSRLTNLDILRVNNNDILSIDPDFFDVLTTLYTFYFNSNLCASARFDNIRSLPQEREIAQTFDNCYYNFIEPATTENCEYVNDPVFGYTCELSNVTFLNFRNKFTFGGSHLGTNANDDVTGIRIRDSNFARVPPSIFRFFQNLEFFALTDSRLENIEADTFIECGQVRHMDLSGNRIRRLSRDSFGGCWYVENLVLDDNRISEIAPCNSFISQIYNANRISMRNNVCVDRIFESGDPISYEPERVFYPYLNRCFSLWYQFLPQPQF